MGNFKQSKFYSAMHLKALAIQKHGEKYVGPKMLDFDDTTKAQLKEDTVLCATLLQGGVNYHAEFHNLAKKCSLTSAEKAIPQELVRF